MAARMRFARTIGGGLCVGLLLLTGCDSDDSFEPGVPAALALHEPEFIFTSLAQNHLILADLTDGGGDPIDTPLTWSTSDPGVVKVNGDGLATALSVGTAIVTVHYGSMTDTLPVTVRQDPAYLVAELGNGQTGLPSQALIMPLTIMVTDALGFRIRNVPITFATTNAGASVSPDTTSTDIFGTAATTFTLGPALGAYTATATVTGTPLSVSFTAQADTGIGPFNIELVFVSGTPTAAQAQAFAAAERRWETVIQGDLPDDYANLPAYSCGSSPAMDRPIDDLVIFVNLGYVDGPGGILGSSGPCFLHDVGLLPAIASMTLDASDMSSMEGEGLLSTVVLHEMGHALGIGTIWSDRGLLADPVSGGGTDPHFTGAQALTAFDGIGGAGYLGAKVPVEDQGGYGTADAHWRETVFGNEVMTGYVNYGSNPLSTETIASLADLGYSVDLGAADPFMLLSALRGGATPVAIHLGNDIKLGPIKIINRKGQIVGTYRR